MTFFKKLFYIFCAFFAFLSPLAAQEPARLGLPLACTPGVDCWVLNYADTGPAGDGKTIDPACGARSYEAHKGTDFAIADEAAMHKGVDVVAAMDGTVARARDGEADRWPTAQDLQETKAARKECGNAVLIDHGDGWQTMHCHMKKDSIIVKPGQKIKRGEKIGEVGLSGFTEFPHLHFGLIHKDKVIDPFSGRNIEEPCDPKSMKALWEEKLELSYEPVVIMAQGFSDEIPKLKSLDKKLPSKKELQVHGNNLVAYVVLLGMRAGDDIAIKIKAPDGAVFANVAKKQDRNHARQLYFTGRKNNDDGFKPGLYSADVKVMRGNADGTKQEFSKNFQVNVR